MANEQNLRPSEYKFSQEEAKRGGKKSGEVRRQKKTMSALATMMVNAQLQGTAKEKVKRKFGLSEDDDLTIASAMMAGQMQSAIRGDSKAFNAISALIKEQEDKEE